MPPRTEQPPADAGRSLTSILWRREAFVFLGTMILSLCFFTVFLQIAFLTLWDRITLSVRQEIEKEGDTIARLLVFEFSHLSALETGGNADPNLDQLVKRLLWEKVTFNETIRGIELISRHTDAQGQHLSYSFFPLTYGDPEAERAPQKSWRRFTGPEGELLRLLMREQRVDRNLLEVVNQGRKLESEMLLRYFPLYIPLPGRGAVFWGAVKVGISVDAMRRFLLLLEEERASLRATLLGAMAVVTLLALVVGLWGFYWQSRKTAVLFQGYTNLAQALESGEGLDPATLQIYLQSQEPHHIQELEALQRLCLRLSAGLEGLLTPLIAAQRQACQGRILGALLPKIAAAELSPAALAYWADLFAPQPEVWGEVRLDRYLLQLGQLLRALLPTGMTCREERQATPPVLGAADNLIMAIMFLVDFAVAEMAPPGEVAWQVAPQPSGGLGVTLTFPGRVYGQEECQRWLRPFQPGTTPPDHLGPGLAAAVARQHGGSLTITPQPGGGLALAFLLPGPIPAAAEG